MRRPTSGVCGPRGSRKLIAARRAGARALLIVGDRLPALSATVTAVRTGLGTLTPAAADILLAPDTSIARLTTTLAERRAPASFVAPRRVEIAVALEAADRTAVNVVGILPGRDPALPGRPWCSARTTTIWA